MSDSVTGCAASPIGFFLLGPLQAVRSGRTLPLGGPRQRAVIALLLLQPNHVIARDEIVAGVWGGRPPPAAVRTLQTYIFHLRRELEPDRSAGSPGELLSTADPGYVLRVDTAQTDVGRFEAALKDGRVALQAGRAGEASRLIEDALALWRGEVLADLADYDFVAAEAARLGHLRLAAVETKLEADLELGRYAAVVAECQGWIAREPMRERLREIAMLGLYRSGRQADALAVYRQARDDYAAELGIDPGPGLERLHDAVLAQDPALMGTSVPQQPVANERPGTAVAEPDQADALASTRQPKRPRRRRILVAGLAVGAVLAVAGTYGAVRTDRPHVVLSAQDRVDVVSVASGEVVEQVLLDQQPSGVARGAGSVWVTQSAAGTVSRLDPGSRRVRATIAVGGRPTGVVVADGSVWVTDQEGGSVVQISPGVDKVVHRVAVGNRPTGIAAGPGGLWVTNTSDGTVTRIEPRTGKASATVDVGADPNGIVAASGAIWVTNRGEGTVSAIDPTTATLRSSYPVGNGPTAIASTAGALWVANSLDGTLARIDPHTGVVTATIQVGNGPAAVTAAGGSVWVGNEDGSTLVRVNPKNNRRDRFLRVGGTPHGLAAVDDELWVTAAATGQTHRGGTLTVLTELGLSMDPVKYQWEATRITRDGLVGIRRAAGVTGTNLVPDLAIAVPKPVDAGMTYAFQLRKGIRYSTGARVRAMDLRRAIERQFRVATAAGSDLFLGIRGAAACREQRLAANKLDDPVLRAAAEEGDLSAAQRLLPSECDLSSGIETDDAKGSVTFHLVSPDPNFLYKLTLPFAAAVPENTPNYDAGTRPIPGTGPYEIHSYTPNLAAGAGHPARRGRLELVRNPYFHEWSRAAQPDGYADRIVFLETDPKTDVDQVLAGKADFAAVVDTERMQELKTRYAAQLHQNLGPYLFHLAFNTTKPPFTDIRARRALNYAVDRGQVLRALGGADLAKGTCQALPPGFPGYAPYCPYQTDLAKARRLVAQSGTAGDLVTVVLPEFERPVGPYLKRVLTSLGYDVRLDVRPDDNYFGPIYRPHPKEDLIFNGWGADYPGAASSMELLFGCKYANPADSSGNLGRFCDRTVEAGIRQALSLQQTQPAAAGRLWQEVDRDVVDKAAMLPLGIGVDVTVTSPRVGNYVHQSLYGVLFDQLWLEPESSR